ncbi:UPF0545 protein C22orf39 homolog [Phymastichus coffea]|uniref:UPF0545 protein C22orf39 homolog n=1 Tax=Phymastichus coffea TaxID=108790 RepID=UPI00273BA10D|nr:UPF0545 protein C22orf39 homolog [Phymastichus coffea]XP_058803356.1 UPF0545 protein C22orf39 homolog [Phymastichus coffea]XP_058803357.1 UPF0545 protein C22orf39 homolog [Phymastichus coffea]XP_058803358.1 UPF0545 protein C22orf39 homolog [Phymastichus coffea]XP_058803359.1 UPF0545 protein C22orf39 homolog [Phymastichus coffea]XP_058803360.1 UPF0545 protein C22orf39 homolog [Phymastichus coffea]XP_058803361.1 UPF0545 protein C22orf39 homolog [Phymastichus coffea]
MGLEKEVPIEEPVRPDEFMIRPCYLYEAEFHECERPKGRFHQLFIFGDYLDCNQWKRDAQLCKKWQEKKDEKARAELIESEEKRRIERLKPHYQNDVWKKRDKPPENWNAPLPDWIVEKNKNTYLDLKAQSIRNGTVNDIDMKVYESVTCSIL